MRRFPRISVVGSVLPRPAPKRGAYRALFFAWAAIGLTVGLLGFGSATLAQSNSDAPLRPPSAQKARLPPQAMFCPGSFWQGAWGVSSPASPACWGVATTDSPSARTLSEAWLFLKAHQATPAGDKSASGASSADASLASAAFKPGRVPLGENAFSGAGWAAPNLISGGLFAVANRPDPRRRVAKKSSPVASEPAAGADPDDGLDAKARKEQKALYAKIEAVLATDPAARGPLRAALLDTAIELSDDSVPGSREKSFARLDEAEALADEDLAQWKSDPTYWPLVAQIERDRIATLEAHATEPGSYEQSKLLIAHARAKMEQLFVLNGEMPRSYQARALWAFEDENLSWAIHPSSRLSYADQALAFERAVAAITAWKLAAGTEEIFWGEGSPRAPSHAALQQAESEAAAMIILRQAWLKLPRDQQPIAAQCTLGWADSQVSCSDITKKMIASATQLRQQATAAVAAPASDADADGDEPQEESWQNSNAPR